MVYEGHTRRAVKSLLNEEMTPLDQSKIDTLKRLHPAGPTSLPRCPTDAPKIIAVDKDLIRDIISREMANGAAPGRSGWTGDLLKAIAPDSECLEGIVTLTALIINGEIEGEAKKQLLTSILVGISKPNGGVRPIAVGEVFYKLAALYALKAVKKDLPAVLGREQFALLPGGSESAIHCLRIAVSTHPQWAVMGCDIKNAFDTRNRTEILECLFKEDRLKSLWRITQWAYGSPSNLLLVDQGNVIETIPSTQGVRQGDALSSLLFALSMRDIYRDTAEASGCDVVAVQDDVYYMGVANSVAKAWDIMKAMISKSSGLELNREKTSILIHDEAVATHFTSRELSPSTTNIPALGSIITRDGDLLSRWLIDKMQTSHKKLFKAILDKSMPAQVAYQILRMCAIPVIQYWMRTTPPTASTELARVFDEEILLLAESLLSLPRCSDLAQKQLFLPVRMGGLGLRAMKQVVQTSWLASLAQSVQYTARYTDANSLSRDLTTEIEAALFHLAGIPDMKALPKSAPDFWNEFAHQPAGPGMQRVLTETIHFITPCEPR